MSKEDIKKRAEELLKRHSIETLTDEKRIIETLINFDDVDEKNIEYASKTLDILEKYLLIKEKEVLKEKDFEFLSELATKLREQSVRKTDSSNPPLFITKDSSDNDVFFITRNALIEYLETIGKDPKSLGTIIEIPSSNSMELARLMEIIKRNY